MLKPNDIRMNMKKPMAYRKLLMKNEIVKYEASNGN